jgi:N-acetylmuramoyl-L-alanine amidase
VFMPAHAAEFTMRSEDTTRIADVPSQAMGGVTYVSLDALAEQFGGGSRVEGRRVQVDLAGQTAIMDLEDVNVYATQTQFSLGKALISIDGRPYIAVDDIPGFFERSFGVAVESGAAQEVLEEELLESNGVAAIDPDAAQETIPPASTAPLQPGSERVLAQRIMIDPGHGGYDTGYISPRGVVEKDLALAMAQLLAEILKQKTGLEILLTRSDDSDASIRDRVQMANEQQADLLISIHGGAAFAQQARGIALYYPAAIDLGARGPRAALDASTSTADFAVESGAVAEAVATAVRQEPDLNLYDIHAMPLRLFDRAGMPGILVEVGFLSNPEEEELLMSDAHRARIANAIADGVVAVLRKR